MPSQRSIGSGAGRAVGWRGSDRPCWSHPEALQRPPALASCRGSVADSTALERPVGGLLGAWWVGLGLPPGCKFLKGTVLAIAMRQKNPAAIARALLE